MNCFKNTALLKYWGNAKLLNFKACSLTERLRQKKILDNQAFPRTEPDDQSLSLSCHRPWVKVGYLLALAGYMGQMACQFLACSLLWAIQAHSARAMEKEEIPYIFRHSDKMTDGIITKIFSHSEDEKTLGRASQVSWRWHGLVTSLDRQALAFDREREELIGRILKAIDAELSPIAVARRNPKLQSIHHLLTEPEALLIATEERNFLLASDRTASHPFFGGIIERERRLAANNSCPGNVLSQYRNYREHCVTLQGNTLIQHITPKAILYIDDQRIYRIVSSLAYKINSINEYNISQRENDAGNHAVCALGVPGRSVHFKNNNCHTDLSPAMESAMYGFYSLIAPNSVTPSFFMRIEGLPIKKPNSQDLMAEWNAVERGDKTFASFINDHAEEQAGLFITKTQNFILQGSRTAEGMRFDKFLEQIKQGQASYDMINRESFGYHILLSLLFNPSDYKADNLFLSPEGHIVGIDNDGCLAHPIVHIGTRQKEYHVGVKNVLYFLPLMQEAIHENVIETVKNLNIPLTLLRWMSFLDAQDKRHRTTFDCQGLERPLEDRHSFPVRLIPGTATSLYGDLRNLQKILADSWGTTHQQLLMRLQPLLGEAYQMHLKNDPDPLTAMSVIYNRTIDLQKLLPRQINNLQSEAHSKDAYTQERKAFLAQEIQAVLPQLQEDDEHLSQVLDYLVRYLPDYALCLSLMQDPMRFKRMFAVGAPVPSLAWLLDHKTKDEASISYWHLAAYGISQGHHEPQKDGGALIRLLKAKAHTQEIPDSEDKGVNKKTALDMIIEDKKFDSAFLWVQEGIGASLSLSNAQVVFNHFNQIDPQFYLKGLKNLISLHQELRWKLALETCLPRASTCITRDDALKSFNYVIGCESGIRILEKGENNKQLFHEGEIIQVNEKGRHPVACMIGYFPIHDFPLYFKFFPEFPGVEEAVRYFTYTLFGTGLPYTELFRWKNTPVLVSQGIEGPDLHQVLENNPNLLTKLEPVHTSGMILAAMLTNPEDGKRDNYILHNSHFIYGIDNDRAFVPGVAKDKDLKNKIMVKTVLFCLDQMQKPIAEKHKKMIQALSMVDFMRDWLNHLEKLNEQYRALFPDSQMVNNLYNPEQQYPCSIAVPFQPKAVARLFDKILRLKDTIVEEPNSTHLELLTKLEPDVARRYRQGFAKGLSVLERFNLIDKPHFGRGHIDQTLTNISQILQSQGIPIYKDIMADIQQGQQFGPRQALQELDKALNAQQAQIEEVQRALQGRPLQILLDKDIEKLFRDVNWGKKSPKEQELLIKIAENRSLQYVLLTGCHSLSNNLLRPLLTDQLITLNVENCPKLDEWTLNYIQDQASQIESLDMSGCTKLKQICYWLYFPLSPLPCVLSSLTFLRLDNCSSLEAIDIEAPYLKRLEISSAPQLSNIELIAPRLESIKACYNSNLQTLSLQASQLSNINLEGCLALQDEELDKMIEDCPSIKEVNLIRCENSFYREIIEKFKSNKYFEKEYINFSRHGIRDFLICILSNRNTNLTSLDLSDNYVTSASAKTLSKLKFLNTLNLRNNNIEDRGLQALVTLTSLTNLDLGTNNIGIQGAQVFKSLTNLTRLNLGGNQICAQGAEALSGLTKLTALHLWMCLIGDEGIKAISSLTKLTNLNLAMNNIRDTGVEFLKPLTNLVQLVIDGNSINDEGIEALKKSLTNLIQLRLTRWDNESWIKKNALTSGLGLWSRSLEWKPVQFITSKLINSNVKSDIPLSTEFLNFDFSGNKLFGILPSGNELTFHLQDFAYTEDDGFHLLGLMRQSIMRDFMACEDNKKIRSIVAPEIYSHLEGGTLTESFKNIYYYVPFLQPKINKKSQFIHHDDNQSLIQGENDLKIYEFCHAPEVYKNHIKHNLDCEGGWRSLIKKIIERKITSSSLDAIAKLKNLKIYIWQRDENDLSILKLIHCCEPMPIVEELAHEIHLLFSSEHLLNSDQHPFYCLLKVIA